MSIRSNWHGFVRLQSYIRICIILVYVCVCVWGKEKIKQKINALLPLADSNRTLHRDTQPVERPTCFRPCPRGSVPCAIPYRTCRHRCRPPASDKCHYCTPWVGHIVDAQQFDESYGDSRRRRYYSYAFAGHRQSCTIALHSYIRIYEH